MSTRTQENIHNKARLLCSRFDQQAYISGEELEWIAVGAFGKGAEHLKASPPYQLFQLGVGEKVIVAVQGLALCPPGHGYLFWLKPEPGLPAVPYGDKGFTTWL